MVKVIVVTFLDSATYNGWTSEEEVLKTKPKVCVASGVLVSASESTIKVALLSSLSTEGDKESYSNWIDIPVSCILSKKVVDV